MKSLFITGTDTGIGKTTISRILLKQFNKKGYKTVGLKPLASGCTLNQKNQLENEDALNLQKTASVFSDYETINPIALIDAVAPHLAAQKMKIELTKKLLLKKIISSISKDADINIIEGAGGWCIPLNDHEQYSDAIIDLKIPVILVIGIRLGCLNHAILTFQSMLQQQAQLIGWIANCVDSNMLEISSNIDTLKQWVKRPCLGIVKNNQCDSAEINIHLIEEILFQQRSIT